MSDPNDPSLPQSPARVLPPTPVLPYRPGFSQEIRRESAFHTPTADFIRGVMGFSAYSSLLLALWRLAQVELGAFCFGWLMISFVCALVSAWIDGTFNCRGTFHGVFVGFILSLLLAPCVLASVH